ncbi:MAG: acyl-CoA dehydrogenase family protein [Deltaproteobacteria bacterium]|nr:acyl-CoA dehydrogenase family protein [Deltaproteobacteria bacterium]
MEDFLHLNDLLTDEEKIIRETLRKFVDEEVTPLMPSAFERGEFPKKLIMRMAELDLFGMTLPAQYGGAEAGYVSYGLACQELERGDSGLRSFVSVQSSLCMFPIFAFGSEEQKQKYLKPMSEGRIIGCFGLTEPDSGSDPSSMRTRAKKAKGGWLLNGSKLWITNAPIADLAIVWAMTEEGIRGFLIEKATEGFFRNPIEGKLSLRASSTGELVMEDCFISDDQLLPGTDKGLSAALSCLTQARYGIAWGAMGAARDCYERALSYLMERTQFGRPLASFQLIQKDLSEMFNEILKAQMLNYRIGRLKEEKKDNYVMASLAKMNGCKEALKIARMARNLLGANGISLDYHIIRHMANLESVFTYEGTDNIHHLTIGRYLTGLSAFT